MRKLTRNLKIFFLFSRFAVKTSFQAKAGVVFFTLGKLLRFGLLFGFVYFLVSHTKTIKGYTLDQAIVFYLTFNIIDTLSQSLFREVYRFRPLVVSGDFSTILVKPYHPFLRVLVGGIDIIDIIMLVPFTIATLYFIAKTGVATPASLLLYVALVTNGILIATAFHIAVLALAILTTEVDHTILIYRDLTTLGRFPIEIYREPVRSFFTFVIPIGIMMSYPSKGLFGLLNTQLILIAFAFCAISLFLAVRLWNNALKKYQSWGG
jgi:ABC-2 type transport system permease protein